MDKLDDDFKYQKDAEAKAYLKENLLNMMKGKLAQSAENEKQASNNLAGIRAKLTAVDTLKQ
jgi:hypothetical protein